MTPISIPDMARVDSAQPSPSWLTTSSSKLNMARVDSAQPSPFSLTTSSSKLNMARVDSAQPSPTSPTFAHFDSLIPTSSLLARLPAEILLRIMGLVGRKEFLASPEKLTISKEWRLYASEALFGKQALIDEDVDTFCRVARSRVPHDILATKLRSLSVRITNRAINDISGLVKLAPLCERLSSLRFEVDQRRDWFEIPTGQVPPGIQKKYLCAAVEEFAQDVEKASKLTDKPKLEIEWFKKDAEHCRKEAARGMAQFQIAEYHESLEVILKHFRRVVNNVHYKPQLLRLLHPSITGHLTDLYIDTTGFPLIANRPDFSPPSHLCPAIARRLPTLQSLELKLMEVCCDVLQVDDKTILPNLKKLVIHLVFLSIGSRSLSGQSPQELRKIHGPKIQLPYTLGFPVTCSTLKGKDHRHLSCAVWNLINAGKLPKIQDVRVINGQLVRGQGKELHRMIRDTNLLTGEVRDTSPPDYVAYLERQQVAEGREPSRGKTMFPCSIHYG